MKTCMGCGKKGVVDISRKLGVTPKNGKVWQCKYCKRVTTTVR